MMRAHYRGTFGKTPHDATHRFDAKNDRLETLLRAVPAVTPKPSAYRASTYRRVSRTIDRACMRATDRNDRHWRRGLISLREHQRIEHALITAAESSKRTWRLGWYRAQHSAENTTPETPQS